MLKLFLNPGTTAHLRGLAEEFDESTNAVRLELNRFEEAGMLSSESNGNKKLYKANESHPLFREINNLLLKHIGVDRIVENMISRVGRLEKLYLTGDYAKGKDSGIIDLVFVGNVDKAFLTDKVPKAEKLIKKKIRYLVYDTSEWDQHQQDELKPESRLLLWQQLPVSYAPETKTQQ